MSVEAFTLTTGEQCPRRGGQLLYVSVDDGRSTSDGLVCDSTVVCGFDPCPHCNQDRTETDADGFETCRNPGCVVNEGMTS